jgi:hypothetical protein
VAVNKPIGDNARKGAVKKRSQLKTTLGGASAWTKRSRASGEFMAVKKPAKKKTAAKKFKGVRTEKKRTAKI